MKKITLSIAALALTLSLTACNSPEESSSEKSSSSSSVIQNSSAESDLQTSDDIISESDIETVKSHYANDGRTVFDAQIIDLDFDGKNEFLVLTHQANPRALELWEKSGGEMNFLYAFGLGKVNYIDKLSFKEGKIDGEKAYLFSFAYDEGIGGMKADEVLAGIVKTADGYDVEYLLSRGTITYSDIAEPFTKEFYRKGWGKGDIGMNHDYGDISKEEYDKLYEEYTENAESGVDTNSNADVIAVLPSFQMIDEIFTDYYVAQNAVYYVNISDNSSWQDVEFTKGDYFGQVLYNTESRDLGSIEPGSSNVLPVGTELYESNEDKTVILAKVDDGFIPYVKIVEG